MALVTEPFLVCQQPNLILSPLSFLQLYCQSLHVLMHYFLVCNYFWMFCEGLYLHTILVVAFVSEEKILKWFYLIGWGIPVVFATAYASFRVNSPDAQK